MNTQQKLEAAQRLIKVVTGEPYGDGMTVTDIGVGYAEPGYHNDDTVWVLGDWNNKSRYENGQRIETSNVPGRLFDALERIGVEGEWSDEWLQCGNCYRIVRQSGDSYQWQAYFEIFDGEVSCGDCLLEMGNDALENYINDSQRVVTWCDESHLASLGWTRWNPSEYQHGLHPGMDDTPTTITAEIAEALPDHDVLFWLDEASQFYIGFSAFTRPSDYAEEL